MTYTTYISLRCRMVISAIQIVPENVDQLIKAAKHHEIHNNIHKTPFRVLGPCPKYIANVLLTSFLGDYIELDHDHVYQIRRKSIFEQTTLPYDQWRLANENARCFHPLV